MKKPIAFIYAVSLVALSLISAGVAIAAVNTTVANGVVRQECRLVSADCIGDDGDGVAQVTPSGGGNTAPVITMLGNATENVTEGTSYADAGATATDAEDGDLTGSIVTTNNVDINTVGSYTVTYDVTDSGSLTDQEVRTVNVNSAGASNGDVVPELLISTRQDGISGDTVKFDASGSTCSDCTDPYGDGTDEAIAWGVLGYSFDFDDSDSGAFTTNGQPKNTISGGSPTAAHTFHCFGSSDPNWDAVDQRCEFNVGVRVQAPDGDYADAFIAVNIQPLYGAGGYYADANIYCVSATSDYGDCPHADSARHLTDFPTNPDNYATESLYLLDDDGSTYARFCPSAEKKNTAAVAYGPNVDPSATGGSRPRVTYLGLASRVGSGSNCFTNHDTSSVAALADDAPAKDGSGYQSDGWGYGQKAMGFDIGSAQLGTSYQLVFITDLDGDNSQGPNSGEFDLARSSNFCIPQNNSGATVQCSDIPYQSMLMMADSNFQVNLTSPTTQLFSCFGCGVVTNAFVGNFLGGADQHAIRINGIYDSLFQDNYLVGNSGLTGSSESAAQGNTLGSLMTIRPVSSGAGAGTGGAHSLTKDPTDYSVTSNIYRTAVDSTEFFNRNNAMIRNTVWEPVQNSDADNGYGMSIGGYYSVVYGNTFNTVTSGLTDNSDDDHVRLSDLNVWGRFIAIRANSYSGNHTSDINIGDWYSTGTYHDTNDICTEGAPSTSGGGLCTGLAPLSIASENWRS